MGTTTIRITTEQRNQLEEYREEGETLSRALDKVLGDRGDHLTESDVEAIVRREIENTVHERARQL